MCRIVYIKNNIIALIAAVVVVTMVVACSSTSGLPEGSQLYVGQKPVKYTNYERNDHATAVREEMDLVLATPPNGSLFGSSTYRSPFPIGLWIWNATAFWSIAAACKIYHRCFTHNWKIYSAKSGIWPATNLILPVRNNWGRFCLTN